MSEQLCPVCRGRGIVPQGFYDHPTGQPLQSTGTSPERCRRCGGVGTIGVVEPLSPSPQEAPSDE